MIIYEEGLMMEEKTIKNLDMTAGILARFPETIICIFTREIEDQIALSEKKSTLAQVFDTTHNKNIDSFLSLHSKKPEYVEMKNEPIKGLQLIEAIRYGVKTYFGIINNFCVLLDPHYLMEAIIHNGLEKGGWIPGDFIWINNKNSCHLIGVNTPTYQKIAHYQATRNNKAIKKKELEVGGIYQDIRGKKAVFLGLVDSTSYDLKDNKTIKSFDQQFTCHPIKKRMLFYKLEHNISFNKQLQELINVKRIHNFSFKETHRYIEKIEHETLPDNMIEKIRDAAIKLIKGHILDYTRPKNSMYKIYTGTLLYYITNYSYLLNMHPYQSPEVPLFDQNKFLIFS